MNNRYTSLHLVLACIGIAVTVAAEPQAMLPEKHFTFLEKYCLDCHDAVTEKGKVNLEDLPFEINTLPLSLIHI